MYKLVPRFLLGLSLCFLTLAGTTGCHSGPDAAAVADNSGPDPADANMAPVDNSQPQSAVAPAPAQGQVLGARYQAQPQQSAEQYAPQAAPQQTAPPDQDQAYQDAQAYDQLDAEGQSPPVEYADQPPPPLPVYDQPVAPAPNYIWTPGYWYWAPSGYYWIPGAWCAPPYYGALWTPGYWGFYGGRYGFHRGFWGLHIGFYGGINYGFGYTGVGYHGGYWNGNNFYYNRSVNRVNVNITHVYNRTVVVNNNTRVAYNGGRGGIAVRPQAAEIAAMRGPRVPPMSTQLQNQREAAQNRQQFYDVNKGRPAVVAAPRPIAAQPGIARPNPGTVPNRPGQPNDRPQIQPVRAVQPEVRPGQPQTRPVQPESRPAQPQVRPVPENRPIQTQPQAPSDSAAAATPTATDSPASGATSTPDPAHSSTRVKTGAPTTVPASPSARIKTGAPATIPTSPSVRVTARSTTAITAGPATAVQAGPSAQTSADPGGLTTAAGETSLRRPTKPMPKTRAVRVFSFASQLRDYLPDRRDSLFKPRVTAIIAAPLIHRVDRFEQCLFAPARRTTR